MRKIPSKPWAERTPARIPHHPSPSHTRFQRETVWWQALQEPTGRRIDATEHRYAPPVSVRHFGDAVPCRSASESSEQNAIRGEFGLRGRSGGESLRRSSVDPPSMSCGINLLFLANANFSRRHESIPSAPISHSNSRRSGVRGLAHTTKPLAGREVLRIPGRLDELSEDLGRLFRSTDGRSPPR